MSDRCCCGGSKYNLECCNMSYNKCMMPNIKTFEANCECKYDMKVPFMMQMPQNKCGCNQMGMMN